MVLGYFIFLIWLHFFFSIQFNSISSLFVLFHKRTCVRTLSILNYPRFMCLFLPWSWFIWFPYYYHTLSFHFNSIKCRPIQSNLNKFNYFLFNSISFFSHMFQNVVNIWIISCLIFFLQHGLRFTLYNTLHKQVHVTQYPYPFSFEFNSNQFYFVIFKKRTCLRILSILNYFRFKCLFLPWSLDISFTLFHYTLSFQFNSIQFNSYKSIQFNFLFNCFLFSFICFKTLSIFELFQIVLLSPPWS